MRRYLAGAYTLAFAGLLCLAQGSQGGDLTLLGAGARVAGGGGGVCCTFVNHGYGEDISGSSSTTMAASAINATTGNLLAVVCRSGTNTNTITVSDTAGNTFTSITSATDAGIGKLEAFYAKNIAGNATNVVTCNYGTSNTFRSAEVLQYSGASATTPSDTSAIAQGHGGGFSDTTGTFTTTAANEVVVAGFTVAAINNTFTAGNIGGSASTLRSTNPSMSGTEDRVVTATLTGATASASEAASQNWLIVAVSFK